MNKKTYENMIRENIEELEKHMPTNSLEKNHIKMILEQSIKFYYPDEPEPKENIKKLLLKLKRYDMYTSSGIGGYYSAIASDYNQPVHSEVTKNGKWVRWKDIKEIMNIQNKKNE